MLAARGAEFAIDRHPAADWPSLRPTWARLHAAAEQPTFFLSPLWMDAWLAVYGPALAAEFVCLQDERGVSGLALVVRRRERRGPFAVRQLYLNTAGEGRDSPMIEHNALLCPAANRAVFAQRLAATLNAEGWDELMLPGMRREDHALLNDLCSGETETVWRDSPYLDLAALRAAGMTFLDSVSSNTRQQIRRSMRLYAERGALMLELAQDPEQARGWFDQMTALHQAVWNSRGKPGAFASPRQQAFHQALIAAGAPAQVQLLRISAGGETLGILYNLCHDGHISYYQSGLRYETDNRLKPGLVCHALAAQQALEAGAREYDFLAAANDGARYKTSLANATRTFGWTTVRRQSLKLRALDAARAARQRWKG